MNIKKISAEVIATAVPIVIAPMTDMLPNSPDGKCGAEYNAGDVFEAEEDRVWSI